MHITSAQTSVGVTDYFNVPLGDGYYQTTSMVWKAVTDKEQKSRQ